MGFYRMYFKREDEYKAYKTEEEYWKDLLAALDLRLTYLCLYHLQKQEEGLDGESAGPAETVRRDLALTLDHALASLHPEEVRKDSGSQGDGARTEIRLALSYIMGRLAYTPRMGDGFCLRRIFRVFGLGRLEQFLFILSVAVYCDAKYETLFAMLQGEGKNMPTLRLGFALYELSHEIMPQERGRLLEQKGSLFEYLVTGDDAHRGPASSRMFLLTKRVYGFVLKQRFLSPELERLVTIYKKGETLPPVLIRQETVKEIERFIGCYGNRGEAPCYVLYLYGENGNGKHFTVKHGAAANGCNVLFVDVSLVLGAGVDEIDLFVRNIKLECILTHSILCFVDSQGGTEDEREPEQPPPMLDYLLKALSGRLGFFIWMTEERAGYLTKYPLHFLALESPMLTVGERMVLWKAYSRNIPLEEGMDLVLPANQYILTARGIREVLIRAEMMCRAKGLEQIGKDDLLAAVKQQSVNQLGRFATLINAVFTWDDLVIDQEQKHQMQLICDQIRYRNVVGEEWGFHRKTPYGRGVCAMFYGSPGTGKTMAVQVMANELGLDLYRIDLSQMVSKYIGETEKNISALFRKAKNINALLFFDEADSLFSKRSEVKDSNDRNANAETAHLLQKLEDYSGITILATNYANNMDDAFKRRIRFMVHFVFPTQEVRYKLWTTIIPKQAVYEEEIDFEFFARKFELSGSNIKEILTNAAYMAAARHRGLANADIVEAVKLNFAKYGKVLTSEDFGYLG